MPETILLVEDDPSLRRLVERMLTKLGYRVIVAGGGDAAVASCREHRDVIDLLITDVFMPDTGGPALAERILTIKPGLKVLFVSGSNEALFDSGIMTQGANFLQKPFTTEQFSRKIREILDRSP